MSYHVLARKWRPQTFADLVGQTHVVKALTFALSQNQIHHAYLFTGTRGVGKTSIARIFAKSLNCQTNGVSPNPCGRCENCREIKSGKFVDLIEVDAASRTGVDETRELIDSVAYMPTKGRYKVYLIDEVHMFSKSSFNALLKTLEEPPAHVKFILATTDPEKLPITILSRCLQFNLKSLTQAQIKQHLVNICEGESIRYDATALDLLAAAGDGSMRDTLSMTDQAIAYGHGELSISAVTEILGTIHPTDIESILFAIATNNPAQLNNALRRLDDYEIDARAFLIEIMRRLQQMAWAKEGIINDLSPTLLSTIVDIPMTLLKRLCLIWRLPVMHRQRLK
ncbi:MAG: DNA polymerase III, subunit gamma and tau [Gammaproteobacteria bacterium]|nr:MAG: DNA polymerase III, subunit gamma and tau [Gammaproteobacteria bacterium]